MGFKHTPLVWLLALTIPTLTDGLATVRAAEAPPPGTIKLFNGKNLDNFYVFLKGRGRDNDPQKVFTVNDGLIRVSGAEFGCITTNEEFANYRLIVEYKWGEQTCAPRVKAARDSGILLHSVGADGAYGGVWMRSIECQLIEGGTADFIVVGDGSEDYAITCPVAPEKSGGCYVYKPDGQTATIHEGRVNWWGRDPAWRDEKGFRGKQDVEKPIGQWNRIECIARGDSITIVLNGVTMNRSVRTRPCKGRIQIQSEGAEIFIRRVDLIPLSAPKTSPAAAAPRTPYDDLVASWTFDEGSGEALTDHSGNGNHGRIHGATWVATDKQKALCFDGEDDYVDCGRPPGLDIKGPVSLQAWVQPTAVNRGEPGIVGKSFDSYALSDYGNVHWYISSGGNNVSAPLKIGNWQHVAGTFDGKTMRIYLNGREVSAKDSKFDHVLSGGNFFIGCILREATASEEALRRTEHFAGFIDDVRVHARCLSPSDIVHYYNLGARGKKLEPIDTATLGRPVLEPFFYPDSERIVLSVDFASARPISKDAQARVELTRLGASDTGPLQTRTLNPHAARCEDEIEFSLKGLPDGQYDLRVSLRNPTDDPGRLPETSQSLRFQLPLAPPASLPAPTAKTVAQLPAAVAPPPYDLQVGHDGGITLNVKGRAFRIASAYSYPSGGLNRMGGDTAGTEPSWKVTTEIVGTNRFRGTGTGAYYRLDRAIEPTPSRVMIRDTFTNTSSDVVGITISNHVAVGNDRSLRVTMMGSPSLFVGSAGCGVGLVALDDLYQIQQRTGFANGLAEVRTDHFGLDKGASYTIEWALYPTATDDYYDFINQVRADEGLNGRVEGSFAFVDRRVPPTRELVALKNLKYASIGCLGFPPDDPEVSLEGYEFTEYPKESAELKKTMGETRQMHTGIRSMFHVAHALYATNKPTELFPDSRAVDASGRQFHYGPDSIQYYGSYFSKKRFQDGWRWWLFYPTLENRFGKEMLRRTEFMVKELGATGMWADGFISGYIPGYYSYDRWDGHSVDIDPKTKLVVRKKNCVPFVALPVLKKTVQIISDHGGTVITNGEPGSRSLWRMNMLSSCETSGGDSKPIGLLHLGRSVTALGNPLAVRNQRDVYRDILGKLEFGSLYFWYGDADRMTHKTIVEHMYPITFETIHAGIVRGKERIVTSRSGIYGWPDDRSLSVVHLYDARGEKSPHAFVTSADASGVRTEVSLQPGQSAVVERLPMTVTSTSPINVRVTRYDVEGIRLDVNGQGPLTLAIQTGRFAVAPGRNYEVALGRQTSAATADSNGIIVRAAPSGLLTIGVRRAP